MACWRQPSDGAGTCCVSDFKPPGQHARFHLEVLNLRVLIYDFCHICFLRNRVRGFMLPRRGFSRKGWKPQVSLQLECLCINHVWRAIQEQKKSFKRNQTSFRSRPCFHFVDAERLSLNRLKVVILSQSCLPWLLPKVESSGSDQIQNTRVKNKQKKKTPLSLHRWRDFRST